MIDFDDIIWKQHPNQSNRVQAELMDGSMLEVWMGDATQPMKLCYKENGKWRTIGNSVSLTGLKNLYDLEFK